MSTHEAQPADFSPRTSILGTGGLPQPPGTEPVFDPLRLCIFTTIAILAWLLTPPLVVVWMSTLALIAYWKAHRAGLTRSRCYLRDVRLVLAYLSVAWILGVVFTVRELVMWLT